jgi:hypothetical protein
MRTHTTLVAALALVYMVAPAWAQTSVTGTWKASFVTPDHSYPARIELAQDGEKLTGSVGSEQGETKLTGTVQGSNISFKFDSRDPGGGGNMLAIGVTGTIGTDGLKGDFTVDGNPTGTFSATRDTAAPAASARKSDGSKPAAAGALDVSGTWEIQVTTSTISASPSMTLKQDGEKITGEYHSQQYGQFPLTGTIKDGKIDLTFVMAVEGNNINVVYSGTVDKDGMNGKVNYGDLMDGTFTGARKK